jgi:hypothetical protein
MIEKMGGQVNISGVPLEDWYTHQTPEGLPFQTDIDISLDEEGGYKGLLAKAKDILGLEEQFATPAVPEGAEGVKAKRAEVAKTRKPLDQAAAREVTSRGPDEVKVAVKEIRAKLKAEAIDAKALREEIRQVAKTVDLTPAQKDVIITTLAKVGPERKAETNRKDLGRAILQVGKYSRANNKSAALSDLKTTMKSLGTFRRGKKPLAALSNAARSQVVKAIEGIDLKNLSDVKRTELKAIEDEMIDLGFNLVNGIQNAPDIELDAMSEIVGKNAIEGLKRLRKRGAKALSANEIRQIDDTIKFAVAQHEQFLGDIAEKRQARQTANKEGAIKSLRPTKAATKETVDIGKQKKPSLLVRAGRVVHKDSMHLNQLVNSATGKDSDTMMNVFDRRRHDGKVKSLKKFFEVRDALSKELKRIGWDSSDIKRRNQIHRIKIGGKTRGLTTDQIMSLGMNLRSARNLEQITETEALVFPDGRVDAPTVAELVDMQDVLTAKERAIMDFLPTLNEKHLMPTINKTWMEMFGYELADDVDYWGIRRQLPQKTAQEVKGKFVENMGMFQPFTGGKQPMRINGFWEQLLQTMQNSASLHGSAVPIRDARALLNDADFQRAMEDAGRKVEFDNIRTIYGRMQGITSDTIEAERLATALLQRAGKGAIARPSAYLAQLGSWVMAYDSGMIPKRYAKPVRGFRVQSGAAQDARMDRTNPFLRMRKQGGRTNIITGMNAAQHGVEMLLFDHVPLTEKPLSPLRTMDRFVMKEIDKGVQRWVAKETNLEHGSDAFWNEVAKRTNEVVRKTQPMWDVDERSVLSSSSNAFARPFFMFRSAREAMLNRVQNAVTNFQKATGKEKIAAGGRLAETAGVTTVSVLTVRLLKDALKRGTQEIAGLTDPEREREQIGSQKVLEDTAANFKRDLVDLIPGGRIINDAVEAAIEGKRFKSENILLAVAKAGADTSGAIQRAYKVYLEDGDEAKLKLDITVAVNAMLEGTALTTGVPTGALGQLTTQPLIRAMRQPTDVKLQSMANGLRSMKDPKSRADRIKDLKAHGVKTKADLQRLWNKYDVNMSSDSAVTGGLPNTDRLTNQQEALKGFKQ